MKQNKIERFKDLLISFRSKYWFMNGEYNKDLDCELNLMLDEGVKFSDFADKMVLHTEIGPESAHALFGRYRLWTANYPYGAFITHKLSSYNIYKQGEEDHPYTKSDRSSRRTVIRLRRQYDTDLKKSEE